MHPTRVLLALAALAVSVQVTAAAVCTLSGAVPEVMTVSGCIDCSLANTAAGAASGTNLLKQSYNYPEPLGKGQQNLWFTTTGGVGTLGCPAAAVTFGDFTTAANTFMSASDGSRPEMAIISENYVKIYVNNGGYHVVNNPATTKTTFYYQLCTVATNGTEACPANYLVLGEYSISDNPFILITDLADAEYKLKVYSYVSTCTTCPTTYTDSSTPLEFHFVVLTTPPTVEITSTIGDYINADAKTGSVHFLSNMKSRWSNKNSDTAYAASTTPFAVYHSLFQVKAPWSSSAWLDLTADNDDGKGMYAYNLNSASQGSYTMEVLNVLVSNYTVPGTVCAPATCHVGCPSMCLSDFSNLDTYTYTDPATRAVYSSEPASATFVYDSTPPTISAACKSGTCSGPIYSTKTMEFEFSCTDSNAPCSFYCAIDGKPTMDPSAASGLSKGYTACTSPATVKAATSGSNTFTVYAVDAAGNAGDLSTPFTFYTDNTAPSVSFASVARRCLIDERYFVPNTIGTGPTSSGYALPTSVARPTSGGHCISGYTTAAGHIANSATQPNTRISNQYGSTTCTCGVYDIETDATTTVLVHNGATYPSLMSADSDTSLNAYKGYYPKSIPDVGQSDIANGATQYLIDGQTIITDSDTVYDFTGLSTGKVLYDVGTSTNNTDDISMTSYMYDTVVQVDVDITREVYNLPSGKYGAVLATKQVNGAYYYHVLQATNSPNAAVNMMCSHTEIKNCIQSAGNPFQMDCGLQIT